MSLRIWDLNSKSALDKFYIQKEDPWKARSIPEKIVRYEEIERLLPYRPVGLALEIACGEGDFLAKISKQTKKVIAMDISLEVLKRASKKFPYASFFNADVRTLPSKFFSYFDLIVWLDAIYWLSREEARDVLRRMSSASKGRLIQFIFSSRIIFPEKKGGGRIKYHWQSHDFATSEEFIACIREFFPLSEAIPVQLNLNVREPWSLSFPQRILRFLLKIFNRLKGYRVCLRLTQIAIRWKAFYCLIEPFVVHLAIVAVSEHSLYCQRED